MAGADERACDCCPHTTFGEMLADELVAEVWEYCPARGCVWQLCDMCQAQHRTRPAPRKRPSPARHTVD